MSTPETSKVHGDPQESLDHLPEHLRSRTDFDVLVEKDGVLLPCYSQALMIHSKVFAQMLEDTNKAGWSAGVAAALGDASLSDAQRFLAMCHLPGKQSLTSSNNFRELGGVIMLAHKLDAPWILVECESAILNAPLYGYKPVHCLAVAVSVGLPNLAAKCRSYIVEDLLKKSKHFSGSMLYTERIGNKYSWNELPVSEYHNLLTAVLCHK